MERFLMWLGYGLCHQLPERSLFGGGMQVPVCARDTGIYVGFMVALILLGVLDRRRPTELPPLGVGVVLIGFLGTMVADGVTSYAGFRQTTNDLRLLTGLLAGFALAAFTAPLLNGQVWRTATGSRVLGDRRVFLGFIVGVPIAFVVLRYLAPLSGPGFALFVGAAILFTFAAVNLVMVCLLPWFERRADRLLDLVPAAAVAIIVTGIELFLTVELKLWLVSAAAVLS